jgi:hypothetical protein
MDKRFDLPDGLIFRIGVEPSCRKYFSFSEAKTNPYKLTHPASIEEGRTRRHGP